MSNKKSSEQVLNTNESRRLLGTGQSLNLQMKQTIVNLKCYFRDRNPDWSIRTTLREISEAIKVSETAVKRVVYEEKKYKKVFAPKPKLRLNNGYQFDTNDRQIVISIAKDLTTTTKTATIKDVWQTIKDNKKVEPISRLQFKKCTFETFRKIFIKMGLKFGQINGRNTLMLKNMVKVREKPEPEKPKPKPPRPFISKAKPIPPKSTPPPKPIQTPIPVNQLIIPNLSMNLFNANTSQSTINPIIVKSNPNPIVINSKPIAVKSKPKANPKSSKSAPIPFKATPPQPKVPNYPKDKPRTGPIPIQPKPTPPYIVINSFPNNPNLMTTNLIGLKQNLFKTGVTAVKPIITKPIVTKPVSAAVIRKRYQINAKPNTNTTNQITVSNNSIMSTNSTPPIITRPVSVTTRIDPKTKSNLVVLKPLPATHTANKTSTGPVVIKLVRSKQGSVALPIPKPGILIDKPIPILTTEVKLETNPKQSPEPNPEPIEIDG